MTVPSRMWRPSSASWLKLLSVASLVVVWWLASLTLPATVLPSPVATGSALLDNARAGVLIPELVATFTRVGASFALAMIFGVLFGTAMGLSRTISDVFDLWAMVALTIPGLCYAIIAFMWFGLNETAAIFSITVTTLPAITINIWEGARNIDMRLVLMAQSFGANRSNRIVRVVIPQMLPYIMAAARFGLGIIWKVTVLVELLGRTSGVGYQLNYWFQLYNMRQVLAWTLFFTIVMLFLELVVLKRVEQRLFSWRPDVRA